MENLLPIFVALTGIAVLLQAGLLLGMYLTMRKTSARLEELATTVKDKALPAIESAQTAIESAKVTLASVQEIVAEYRPKVKVIIENVEETTSSIRAQVDRANAVVNDAVDRARLQIIRSDEMLTRTLDKVEQTSDAVTRTVVSPVKQVSGIIQGVTAGVEFLFGSRSRKNGRSREPRGQVPQDEMFI
jgi:SMC interacting uncharacterized protein involved in chromosome segregation